MESSANNQSNADSLISPCKKLKLGSDDNSVRMRQQAGIKRDMSKNRLSQRASILCMCQCDSGDCCTAQDQEQGVGSVKCEIHDTVNNCSETIVNPSQTLTPQVQRNQISNSDPVEIRPSDSAREQKDNLASKDCVRERELGADTIKDDYVNIGSDQTQTYSSENCHGTVTVDTHNGLCSSQNITKEIDQYRPIIWNGIDSESIQSGRKSDSLNNFLINDMSGDDIITIRTDESGSTAEDTQASNKEEIEEEKRDMNGQAFENSAVHGPMEEGVDKERSVNESVEDYAPDVYGSECLASVSSSCSLNNINVTLSDEFDKTVEDTEDGHVDSGYIGNSEDRQGTLVDPNDKTLKCCVEYSDGEESEDSEIELDNGEVSVDDIDIEEAEEIKGNEIPLGLETFTEVIPLRLKSTSGPLCASTPLVKGITRDDKDVCYTQRDNTEYPTLSSFKPQSNDETVKGKMPRTHSQPLCSSTPVVSKPPVCELGRDANVKEQGRDKIGRRNIIEDILCLESCIEDSPMISHIKHVEENEAEDTDNIGVVVEVGRVTGMSEVVDKDTQRVKRIESRKERKERKDKKKLKGTKIEKFKEYMGPGLTSNLNSENEPIYEKPKDYLKNTDVETCTLTEYKGFGLTGPLPDKPLHTSTPAPAKGLTIRDTNIMQSAIELHGKQATENPHAFPKSVSYKDIIKRPAGTEGFILHTDSKLSTLRRTNSLKNELITQRPIPLKRMTSQKVVQHPSLQSRQSLHPAVISVPSDCLSGSSGQMSSGTSSALQPDDIYPCMASVRSDKSDNCSTDRSNKSNKSNKSDKPVDVHVLQSPGSDHHGGKEIHVDHVTSCLLDLGDQIFNTEPVSDCYRKKCINGENVYFCMLCGRSLSRKQRMQSHLVAIHNKSPFKRQKKRYLDDSSVPVPKRTIRWQEKRKKDSLRYQVDLNINEENEVMIDSPVELDNRCNLQEEDVHITPACSTGELAEAMLPQTMEYSSDSGSSYDKDSFVEQDSTEESSIDRSTDSSDSDFSDGDMSDNDEKCHTPNDSKKMLSACESQAFCLVSFILKHNLSASAGKDLLNLLQTLCPESEYFNKLKYEHLLKDASDHEPKVVHYCSVCQNRFPDDPDVIYCTISDCPGLRYVGPLSSQTLSNRELRCCFVIADIQSQLCSLIERNHIWNTIQDTKRSIILGDAPSFITDIKDGEAYRIHCHPGGCLYDQNALSAIFNTDGVPLFNSSKIKLWPIFICINELPPSQRFARENTILAALWQGKDKPPFFQYISAFGDEMSKLHLDGFYAKPLVCVDPIHVHLTVLLASVDLQAKAYVTNMTMHNGSYGCITCEEKGVNVKQGKGYSHYYPYRQTHEKPVMRDSNDVKYVKAFQASKKKRVIGITGVSGILALECFDMVQGMVPDYMHGVLLGVTKTLLNKWFSPTQSGKPYFMGKHMNSISKRMSNIKPPDYIERLPRNLEKNYNHFKATELQTWLLYYALPCLVGYLGYDYLEHFACFSEGIHILLRDRISQPDLDRAQTLLDTFYRDFANLYGEGSCGLNVHNIGSHLVHYVRLWGPLYGWSCFGFEDSNAELLNAIHGTGNVLKPVLKMKQVQFKIWSLDLTSFEKPSEMQFLSKMVPRWRKRWKKLTKCENCYICGAPTTCQFENDQKEFFLQKTKATSVHDLRKVKRVKVNDQYLYCKEYSRMNQRICHVVLCENDKRYSVEYFLLNKTSNTVYAVGKIIEVEEQIHICQSAGHHLLRVKLTLDIQIFEVDKIKEKLFYMTPCENMCVIGQVPNQHGHGVFK